MDYLIHHINQFAALADPGRQPDPRTTRDGDGIPPHAAASDRQRIVGDPRQSGAQGFVRTLAPDEVIPSEIGAFYFV